MPTRNAPRLPILPPPPRHNTRARDDATWPARVHVLPVPLGCRGGRRHQVRSSIYDSYDIVNDTISLYYHYAIMHHYYFIIRFDAGFTVEPRKGRAVLWPATLDADPFKKDERTHHEARPLPTAAVYISGTGNLSGPDAGAPRHQGDQIRGQLLAPPVRLCDRTPQRVHRVSSCHDARRPRAPAPLARAYLYYEYILLLSLYIYGITTYYCIYN